MSEVVISSGSFRFVARFETAAAPRTCEAFMQLLPFTNRLVHVRWSGEAVWVPLGDLALGLPAENATSYPSPGQVIVYPGGISETEILISYGATRFASKAGQLAGNHCSPSCREPSGSARSAKPRCGTAHSRWSSTAPSRLGGRLGAPWNRI
jgi:hypothetical protein